MNTLFGSADVDEAVGDAAWLQAMLDAEAALAGAEADAGLIPAEAAAEIASACKAERFDISDIGRRAVAAGNPAAPMVRDLVAAVAPDVQRYVHLGATSQDIIDTALSLLAQRALDIILADLRDAAAACATLTATHRDTLMTARTLLQPALPTTFGLKAAGWLVGIGEARALLAHVRAERLAAQLGGAAGTLASLREAGVDVAHRFAERLGLAEAVVPWHTDRTRVAELAAALGTVIGVLGKMARDITLLAQGEVGEAGEAGDAEHGTSSTLPQKHNPVRAVLIIAAAERAPGLVATIFHAMVQEHERATGAWHAEWESVRALLRLAGGAGHHAAQLLSTLSVEPERMAANLGSDGGLVMAESLAGVLAAKAGRIAARDIVRRCSGEAAQRHIAFATVVATDPEVSSHLTAAEIAAALDPVSYLGSTQEFIARAERAHDAAEARG